MAEYRMGPRQSGVSSPGRAGWRWVRTAVLVAVLVTCSGWTTAPVVAPETSSAPVHTPAKSAPTSPTVGADEPQICQGCAPPLTYLGGPVMSTTPAGVTVTPVYWEPGGKYSFSSDYKTILDDFITNVAAASGTTSNVYSVSTEYSQTVGGTKSYVSYKVTAGTPTDDTDAFPADGCTADTGYTACLTDAQLQAELKAVIDRQHLPTGLAYFYPVFLPPGVETQDVGGTTSASNYCAYHGAFGPNSSPIIYGDMPVVAGDACNAGQDPNGNLDADGMLSTFSHELTEAITDPLPQGAWQDSQGNEIGDECAQTFGPPLGSTDPSNPSTSEYNQVINGGKYYLQTLFSNYAYATYGLGKGCAQSEAQAHPHAAAAPHVAKVTNAFVDPTPIALPADGTSKSTIVVTASDKNGNGVAGDHVHLSVGAQTVGPQWPTSTPSSTTPSSTGVCGTLNNQNGTTDANGNVTVTYTASTSNVACTVYAVEANGGNSAQTLIYQGTAQKDAATIRAAFPTTLQAGAPATTFTVKVANPSTTPMPNARLDLAIFPGTGTTQSVHDSQITMTYSTAGADGPFTDVGLTGSTADGNVIDAYLGNQRGTTLAPGGSQTWTFHVSLASDVPGSTSTPLMAFEAYLDQINTASGSGATLADSYATDIKVTPSSSSGGLSTGWYVLIAVGGLVILAVIAWLLWRGRRGHPQAPTPQTTS